MEYDDFDTYDFDYELDVPRESAAKNGIRPGSYVTLDPENGLGCGTFVVIDVDPRDGIHQLHVRGPNGQTWWARSDGARIVSR